MGGAAAMLLPSAEETREVGRQLAEAAHGQEGDHDAHEAAGHDDGGHEGAGDAHGADGHGEHTREVNLGAYHIVSFNPKTRQSLSVDFELFGTVLAGEEEEFSHLYAAHEKRISEQITIAVRGMQADDLTDPAPATTFGFPISSCRR